MISSEMTEVMMTVSNTAMTARAKAEFHANQSRLLEQSWRHGQCCMRLSCTGTLTSLGLTYRDDDTVIVWSGGPDVIAIPTGGKIEKLRIAYSKAEIRKLVTRMCRDAIGCMEDIKERHRAGKLIAPGVVPPETHPAYRPPMKTQHVTLAGLV